jgi:hypothetical protein
MAFKKSRISLSTLVSFISSLTLVIQVSPYLKTLLYGRPKFNRSVRLTVIISLFLIPKNIIVLRKALHFRNFHTSNYELKSAELHILIVPGYLNLYHMLARRCRRFSGQWKHLIYRPFLQSFSTKLYSGLCKKHRSYC